MYRKVFFASVIGALIFTGALSAGVACVPYWDSAVNISVSHLGVGTSADCTITFYNAAGTAVLTSTHTFTAQHQSHTFATPGAGGGYAYLHCDEQAIAHGFFVNGSAAFGIPIYGGMPF